MLQITDVKKSYNGVQALAGVTFSVAQNEIFGLLGPNGAGKTTLLSIISCLLEQTSGEIVLDGALVNRWDRDIRRLIGIVPQELALYEELTPQENLRFVGQLYGIADPELKSRIEEVLELIGLQDRCGQQTNTFSGGMKRRLNLGLALVHKPRLLLLDEPTTGVDAQSRNHIFEGVRRLNKEGMTIVYTSHYMEEVQTLCSRVGIIDHGELIACDSIPALLRQMNGVIRIRVTEITPELRTKIQSLNVVALKQLDGEILELECNDVKPILLQLAGLLNELHIDLTSLETEEPNLERVFLNLTGRALRD